jgi:hypothetical protein
VAAAGVYPTTTPVAGLTTDTSVQVTAQVAWKVGHKTARTTLNEVCTVGWTDSDYYPSVSVLEIKGQSYTTGTVYTQTDQPTIVRGPLRAPEGLEVASLEITMDPGTGSIGATPMRSYAIQGGFNDVRVLVSRSYTTGAFGDTNPGLITLFDGIVSDVQVGSTEIRLTAMSNIDKLNEELPRRKFQQLCPYNIYDPDCGVSKAAWTTSSLSSYGNLTQVTVSTSATNNYYSMGTLWFTSGALSGTVRTITGNTWGGSTTTFTVFPPLPVTASGPVSFVPGCSKWGNDQTPDKYPPSCWGFNNLIRYGGFNSIPSILSTKS